MFVVEALLLQLKSQYHSEERLKMYKMYLHKPGNLDGPERKSIQGSLSLEGKTLYTNVLKFFG